MTTANAGIKAGEWLAESKPLIADVSQRAGPWWDKVVKKAYETYSQWLSAGPMERLSINPKEIEAPGFERLESRVVTMLLGASPQDPKTEIVVARELTTVKILYKILKSYQPGGQGEKPQLLQALTAAKPAKTAQEAIEGLRSRQRHYVRANELSLMIPDPLLQVAALSELVKTAVQVDTQAQFRINNFRMVYQVDVTLRSTSTTCCWQSWSICTTLSNLNKE